MSGVLAINLVLASYCTSQRTAVNGAAPVARVPAKAFLLEPQPALRLGGTNRSSCPLPDLRTGPKQWRIGDIKQSSVKFQKRAKLVFVHRRKS